MLDCMLQLPPLAKLSMFARQARVNYDHEGLIVDN